MISGHTRRKILIPQNFHIVRVYVTAVIFESNFNRLQYAPHSFWWCLYLFNTYIHNLIIWVVPPITVYTKLYIFSIISSKTYALSLLEEAKQLPYLANFALVLIRLLYDAKLQLLTVYYPAHPLLLKTFN